MDDSFKGAYAAVLGTLALLIALLALLSQAYA